MIELAKALMAFQAEMEAVKKTSANPFFTSTYANLNAIVEESRPVAARHGLVVIQNVSNIDGQPALHTMLAHIDSGETITSIAPLSMDKTNPQAQGSAITYMRRYAWSTILGLLTEDDDDGNSAVTQQARQEPQHQYQAPPPPRYTSQPEGSHPDDPNSWGISKKQRSALWAICKNQHQLETDADHLDVISSYLGRNVDNTWHITKQEAMDLLDNAQFTRR
jgi:hypothetical protein